MNGEARLLVSQPHICNFHRPHAFLESFHQIIKPRSRIDTRYSPGKMAVAAGVTGFYSKHLNPEGMGRTGTRALSVTNDQPNPATQRFILHTCKSHRSIHKNICVYGKKNTTVKMYPARFSAIFL